MAKWPARGRAEAKTLGESGSGSGPVRNNRAHHRGAVHVSDEAVVFDGQVPFAHPLGRRSSSWGGATGRLGRTVTPRAAARERTLKTRRAAEGATRRHARGSGGLRAPHPLPRPSAPRRALPACGSGGSQVRPDGARAPPRGGNGRVRRGRDGVRRRRAARGGGVGVRPAPPCAPAPGPLRRRRRRALLRRRGRHASGAAVRVPRRASRSASAAPLRGRPADRRRAPRGPTCWSRAARSSTRPSTWPAPSSAVGGSMRGRARPRLGALRRGRAAAPGRRGRRAAPQARRAQTVRIAGEVRAAAALRANVVAGEGVRRAGRRRDARLRRAPSGNSRARSGERRGTRARRARRRRSSTHLTLRCGTYVVPTLVTGALGSSCRAG